MSDYARKLSTPCSIWLANGITLKMAVICLLKYRSAANEVGSLRSQALLLSEQQRELSDEIKRAAE